MSTYARVQEAQPAPEQGPEGAGGQADPGADPGADPAKQESRPADQMTMFIMIGFPLILFWFLIWRPNRRRDQERKSMLSQVKKNDHVVTIGGIKGVVTSVKAEGNSNEDEVTIKVDESTGAKIRVVMSSVARIESRTESEPTKK